MLDNLSSYLPHAAIFEGFAYGLTLTIDFALQVCGRSAVGSAEPCQGSGRGFEPRRPLHLFGCFKQEFSIHQIAFRI